MRIFTGETALPTLAGASHAASVRVQHMLDSSRTETIFTGITERLHFLTRVQYIHKSPGTHFRRHVYRLGGRARSARAVSRPAILPHRRIPSVAPPRPRWPSAAPPFRSILTSRVTCPRNLHRHPCHLTFPSTRGRNAPLASWPWSSPPPGRLPCHIPPSGRG